MSEPTAADLVDAWFESDPRVTDIDLIRALADPDPRVDTWFKEVGGTHEVLFLDGETRAAIEGGLRPPADRWIRLMREVTVFDFFAVVDPAFVPGLEGAAREKLLELMAEQLHEDGCLDVAAWLRSPRGLTDDEAVTMLNLWLGAGAPDNWRRETADWLGLAVSVLVERGSPEHAFDALYDAVRREGPTFLDGLRETLRLDVLIRAAASPRVRELVGLDAEAAEPAWTVPWRLLAVRPEPEVLLPCTLIAVSGAFGGADWMASEMLTTLSETHGDASIPYLVAAWVTGLVGGVTDGPGVTVLETLRRTPRRALLAVAESLPDLESSVRSYKVEELFDQLGPELDDDDSARVADRLRAEGRRDLAEVLTAART